MAADLEDLLGMRLSVRDALAAGPPGSPLRHVLAWIWRTASTGSPLTTAGQEHGMELRVSRYQSPQY